VVVGSAAACSRTCALMVIASAFSGLVFLGS
jgi:hypothetical protein